MNNRYEDEHGLMHQGRREGWSWLAGWLGRVYSTASREMEVRIGCELWAPQGLKGVLDSVLYLATCVVKDRFMRRFKSLVALKQKNSLI